MGDIRTELQVPVVRGLRFCMTLSLLPYFVYARGEGSDRTVRMLMLA